MKNFIYLVFVFGLWGCAPTYAPLKQIEIDSIKKCAYVNILKEPKISCSVNTDIFLGRVSEIIGPESDSKKTKEINEILNNFNMDKVFSFKVCELLSTKAHFPIIPSENTDTLSWIKKIKSSPKEETISNYLLEKRNVYTPFLKDSIEYVLETYINWYGIDKPDVTSSTKVNIKFNAKLIHIRNSKILWEKDSLETYSMENKTYEYDEFIANGGAKLRVALVEAAEIAANELLEKFLTIK
jgi:hypothetical protein